MSRSGYSDDCDGDVNLYRGAVDKALKGKRGQAFLKELLDTLNALPEKKLIANSFKTSDGDVCALGAIAVKRGIDTKILEKYENDDVWGLGKIFGIADSMAAEIMFENDDDFGYRKTAETSEERFARIRAWVVKNITNQELITP